MEPVSQLAYPGSVLIASLAELPVSLFVYLICLLLPAGLLCWLIQFLLSLPMRRRERARFFLDLIETPLARGQAVEPVLVSMAQSRDRAMGVRFHLLAAHLETGQRLGQGLARVPRFLPPALTGMLQVGERLGDLRRVLPACREWLQDYQSGVQNASNYLTVLLLVLSPITLLVINMLMVYVVPKMREIAYEMGVPLPALPQFFFEHARLIVAGQGAMFLVLLAGAVIYLGGPRLVSWVQSGVFPFADWIAWQVPWKRRRLQRTFSAMLAVLLDGGVPEAEALTLAGECTANLVFRRRAARAAATLAQGVRLTEAVQALDGSGEFRWRLTNAIHAHGGFLRALAGWHEALDAKAFQQEQSAAHVLTSGVVFLNGAVVALVAAGMFGTIIALINQALTW